MAEDRSRLGLIGHGTTGNDRIARGIHLRWQFAPELGFPPGFQLYRRLSSDGPKPCCVDFRRVKVGDSPRLLVSAPEGKRVELDAPKGQVANRQRTKPPYPGATSLLGTAAAAGIHVLELGRKGAWFRFPESCHHVKLIVDLGKGGHVQARAFFDQRQVAAAEASSNLSLTTIELCATEMDAVHVRGHGVAVVSLCRRPIESCKDKDVWQALGGPICLPIHYPGRLCGDGKPQCDDEEIGHRLPIDPCERARFGADVRGEIASALRILIAPGIPLSQHERALPDETEADECVPPGEEPPDLSISVLDALLLAAMDPVMARVLGLYHIDNPGPKRRYDYKLIAEWPPGTLWHLPERQSFDDARDGRGPLNVFAAGPLILRTRVRPSLIDRPNPWLGTHRALGFLETDDRDWNLPADFPRPGEDAAVAIYFPESVGEVQIHLGQALPNVELRAFDGAQPVSEWVSSTRREAVLAVHANADERRITHVVLRGRHFWLQRIAWGPDHIAHGPRCAYAYDLAMERADPLAAPVDVTATPLPGLVQKLADCGPLRQGATRDARRSMGVRWRLPDDTTSNAEVPVRYDVLRDDGGQQTLVTTEGPVVVRSPKDAPAYAPPPGWPLEQPLFVDAAVEPGPRYYRVVAIDLFGRRSDPSELSNEEEPEPPPPPAPTNVKVHVIDRLDRSLRTSERGVLPVGIDEALCLRWTWSLHAERQAPDAAAFRVYFAPRRPNVLDGQVEAVTAAGTTATVLVKAAGAVAEHLLAGRYLVQGSRKLRILRHAGGVAVDGDVRFDFDLRLPEAPSSTRPSIGPCTIALDASVPAQVRNLTLGDDVQVVVRTTALGADPASGLVGAVLRIRDVRLFVTAAALVIDTGAYREWKLTCDVRAGDARTLELVFLPVWVPVELPQPPTPAYRNYRSAADWPNALAIDLPRTAAGAFELILRAASAGEAAGLTQPAPGHYLLLRDFPPDLAVTAPEPSRQMTFGVTCVGADGQESAISSPATVARIYQGPVGPAEGIAKLNPEPFGPPDAPPSPLEASAPNFAGKSTFDKLSWPNEAGWTYEVHRALDETVFAVDHQIRKGATDGRGGHFDSDAAVTAFVDQYPGLEAELRNLVVTPTALNRNAIDQHRWRDVLLQALASLPGNDRAFTRLALPAKNLVVAGGTMTCTDNSIDGRAAGRYFYRIRALSQGALTIELGRATRPVYVRGRARLSDVAWELTSAAAGANDLRWRAVTNATAYAVFRTEKREVAESFRGIGAPRVVRQTADTAPIVVIDSKVWFRPQDGVTQIYGIFRSNTFDPARVPLRDQLVPNLFDAAGTTGARLRVTSVVPSGTEVTVVYANKQGVEQATSRTPGMYAFRDTDDLVPSKTYYYRVRATRDGAEPGVSPVVTLACPVALEAPAPVAEAVANQIRVEWAAVPAMFDVRLQRCDLSTAPDRWTTVADWRGAAAGPFVDANAEPAHRYIYRLFVRDSGRVSRPSAESAVAELPP